jgi:8-amino-7-oxononanoate synthase
MRAKNIAAFLQQKRQQSLYRATTTIESAQQSYIKIAGQTYLNFCSNDYLGLANHPKVVQAFQNAANHYGVGAGSAHLINGHSQLHQQLEQALAEFTGRARALLFSTGYMANIGVINALMERGDVIHADRLNHASLVDAALLSRAKMRRYQHNDLAHLAKNLQMKPDANQLIVCDAVFSMDGDTAPIQQMAALAKQYQAWFMLDDAHGLGVLGKKGAGLLEQQALSEQDVPILMATLGKALGTAGAFIAGSEELIEYLIQTARTWIYTTAMPPAIAAATLASLKIVEEETWRREKLAALIQQFRHGAQQLNLQLMPSDTAIQPIVIGSAVQAVQVSEALRLQKILVSAIRPPTVPQNTARLRVTLSALHTEQDVIRLLDSLGRML